MRFYALILFSLSIACTTSGRAKSGVNFKTDTLVKDYAKNNSEIDGLWRSTFEVKGQAFQVFLKIISVNFSAYEAQKNPEFKDSGYVAGIYTLQTLEKRGVNDQCKAGEEIHVPLRGRRFGNKVVLEGLSHHEDLIYDATVVNIKLPLTKDGRLKARISRLGLGKAAGKGGTENLELDRVAFDQFSSEGNL